MEFRGILKHLDTSIRYDQTMNATENIIKEFLLELIDKNKLTKKDLLYLIACMSCAFSCLMEGLGYLDSAMFTFPGKAKIKLQMDDAHFLISNDPHIELHKGKIDSYYFDTWIRLARDLYNCPAYQIDNLDFDDACGLIWNGNGIQICLDNPRHGEALVDTNKQIIRYHDSWGGRPGLWNNGVHEILTREEWETNVIPSVAIYPPK
jgi:hypothetical protein